MRPMSGIWRLDEVLAKDREVNNRNYAYLTDRVLVAEKKPQLYGTQFNTKDGELIPFPIEDEANKESLNIETSLS